MASAWQPTRCLNWVDLASQGSGPVLQLLVQTGISVRPVGSLVGHKTWSEPALEAGTGLVLLGSRSGVPKGPPPQAPPPNTFMKATSRESPSSPEKPGPAAQAASGVCD